MRSRTVTLSVVGLAATVAAVVAFWRAGRTRPPNIVVVAIDTLRADALGCYGGPAGRTPAIDRLAADGYVFDAATAAAGWTLPSFGSLLTGLYPPAHGATRDDLALSDATTTFAERLRDAGYATAAFTGGGWVAAEFGFAQGFDRFDAARRPTNLAERVERAKVWLRERAPDDDAPFLLFVHAYDPHDPYAPDPRPGPPDGYLPPPVLSLAPRLYELDETLTPSEAIVTAFTYPGDRQGLSHSIRGALERLSATDDAPIEERWREEADFAGALGWMRRNYDAEVAVADRAVAALLDALAQAGELEDTLVVLLSDHGEAFMEQGRLEHRHVDPGVARVPLVVRPPPRLRTRDPGARVEDVVSGADLFPTLLDYAGLRPASPIQGRSLRPAIDGAALPPAPAACFVDLPGRAEEASLRQGRHRLVVGGPRDPERRGRLYDVAADPDEQHDLAAREPELHRRMRDALDELRAQSGRLREQHEPIALDELDPETRAHLRALGYLGGG